MGDATKAQEVFQSTMHEAALRAAQGELPADHLWLFRDARGRCLEASESGIQAEEVEMEEHEISAKAPSQIARLEPAQLAIWIAEHWNRNGRRLLTPRSVRSRGSPRTD